MHAIAIASFKHNYLLFYCKIRKIASGIPCIFLQSRKIDIRPNQDYNEAIFSVPEVRNMKYIRQILLIFLFSFLGELLRSLIPLPIPASIYGMILLFLSLSARILRLEDIQEQVFELPVEPSAKAVLDLIRTKRES